MRRYIKLVSLVTAFAVVMAGMRMSAADEKCEEDDAAEGTGAVIGGLLGGAAGVAGSVAAGGMTITGITLTGAAATGGGAAITAGIAADCAVTFCAITISTIVLGAIFGYWISGNDPEDCAGAIALNQQTQRFNWVWNMDATRDALEASWVNCAEDSRNPKQDCGVLMSFRRCAAIAKDTKRTIWRAVREDSLTEVKRKARAECEVASGHECTVTMAVCNRG